MARWSLEEALGVAKAAASRSAKIKSTKVCKHQCSILIDAFEHVRGFLEHFGTEKSLPWDEFVVVLRRGLHLLKSCQDSDWIVWGLLFEEGHMEFQSIYREIYDCIELTSISLFHLGPSSSEESGKSVYAEAYDLYRMLKKSSSMLEEASVQDRKELMFLTLRNELGKVDRNGAKSILAFNLLGRYPAINSRVLTQKRFLESGGYSVVYEATWMSHKFVVKEFLHGEIRFIKELKLLRTFKHPNVLHIAGHTLDESTNQCSLVMEKMDMDLAKYILKQQYPLPELSIIDVLLQIATGMEWLHSMNVIHRDLKPQNILVGEKEGVLLSIRIADFGLSLSMIDLEGPDEQGTFKVTSPGFGHHEHSDPEYTTHLGTKGFMAPEVWNCERYSNKADVYSFGMLCYQLCTGNIRLQAADVDMKQVLRGRRPEIPLSCSEFSKLIQDCWSHDPDKRPDFSDICRRLKARKAKVITGIERVDDVRAALIKAATF